MRITRLMLHFPRINVNKTCLRSLCINTRPCRAFQGLGGSLGPKRRSQSLYAIARLKHIDHRPESQFPKGLNVDEPLKILFCGSDEFSAESLRQLYREKADNPELIKYIHVVVKAGKPAGRGLKEIRDVPLRSVARELSLPCSEIHTFTGWTPPSSDTEGSGSPNLVIAVSFGLLVPPRILSASKYGGLNVHPSLLPEFRGPAPLQWTLLEGRKRSGITVQSLHPAHFDGGKIVEQDTFHVPKNGECTFAELLTTVAPAAGKLLVHALRKGSFRVDPHQAPPQEERSRQAQQGVYARKITSADTIIDWNTWRADKIIRYQRALGHLSGYVTFADLSKVHDQPLEAQRKLKSCTIYRAKWSGFRVLPNDMLSSAGAVRLKATNEKLRELLPGRVKGSPHDSQELERGPLLITWENIIKINNSGQKGSLDKRECDTSVRTQESAHVVDGPESQAFESKGDALLIRTCDGKFLMPTTVKLPGAKAFQDLKKVALSEMKKTIK